jgi:hypothetical protein
MSESLCCHKVPNFLVGYQPLHFCSDFRYIHYGALIPWAPVRGNGGENKLIPPNVWDMFSSAICLFFATTD